METRHGDTFVYGPVRTTGPPLPPLTLVVGEER
jgi:hypothetical protein